MIILRLLPKILTSYNTYCICTLVYVYVSVIMLIHTTRGMNIVRVPMLILVCVELYLS